jgi:hypothetical protein
LPKPRSISGVAAELGRLGEIPLGILQPFLSSRLVTQRDQRVRSIRHLSDGVAPSTHVAVGAGDARRCVSSLCKRARVFEMLLLISNSLSDFGRARLHRFAFSFLFVQTCAGFRDAFIDFKQLIGF